jgi:hypothetical protein
VTVRIRTVLAVGIVLAVLLGVGGYAVFHGMRTKLPAHLSSDGCTVDAGGEVTLDAEQMANAATITAVGVTRGLPDRAIVIALATALQESKLYNLPGGDRDSVGLFQQRPSQGWGRPDQVIDPRYSSRKFYAALVKVRGWETMRVTDAAQAVQRSAHPELYQQWEPDATVLAKALLGSASKAVSCTVTTEPTIRGSVAAVALHGGLLLDWGTGITLSAPDAAGVKIMAGDDQTGWRYAHWLVSHAEDQGVQLVRFGAQEWTARGGTWNSVQTTTATGTVVAEVYR